MPQGDKSAYTDKQKRKAEHIEEGYERRGVPEGEAERRAWATVNKMDHGGKKSGSGVGKKTDLSPAKKGGRKGGAAAAKRKTKSSAGRTRTAAGKTAARKTTVRKATARKTTARKTSARPSTARKTTARKTTARAR